MKRILIIENEADAAETMRRILEEKGYSAQCVPEPRKGLKLLKKFDLLLLDAMMPGM
jgi:CheY-like chemotaxis protein